VKKQLKYANNNNISFVVFIENDSVMQLKNMLTGEQKIFKENEIIEEILRK
jgi:histidyl-tRNA synthetase